MKIMLALAMLMSVLMSAGVSFAADEFDVDTHEAFDEWINDAFNIEPPVESTILALSELLSLKTSGTDIGHSSEPLTAKQYFFAGLVVSALVEDLENGRAFIERIEISSDKYALRGGLKVGAGVDVLQSMPVKPAEDSLEFCGINNCVSFEEYAGKIAKITINLYVD